MRIFARFAHLVLPKHFINITNNTMKNILARFFEENPLWRKAMLDTDTERESMVEGKKSFVTDEYIPD